MRLRGRTALLLLVPFVVIAIVSRGFVPTWGDWLARMLRDAAVVVAPRVSPRRAPAPPVVADPNASGRVIANPDPNATPNASTTPNATATPTPTPTPTPKPTASAPPPSPPPGPLRIPADKVQRAIDDAGRTIRARTTWGPDGKPIGARVTGVNGAGLGLRDGDIIVAVDGKPTMDDDAATDAALSVVARGDSILHAKLTRDGQPFDVTLELPLAPVDADAGKDAR